MRENSASLTVGRLLEVRAEAGYRTRADVDAIFDAIGRELSRLPPDAPYHVTVVDWRYCPIMSPEAADRMTIAITGANTNTLRCAALARDESPVAVLQFVRLIREANLPDRKLFLNENVLCEWLSEVLTKAEFARLKQFLAEGKPLVGQASSTAR